VREVNAVFPRVADAVAAADDMLQQLMADE